MGVRQLAFGICFILGVSLILFHRSLIDFLSGSENDKVVLAKVSKSEGNAEIKSSNQKVSSLQENDSIHDQDLLSITGGNPLRIRFGDAMEVELDAGSVAFFENTDRGVYVTFRTGGF